MTKKQYEYQCPRCDRKMKTPFNLTEQPTCANFTGHKSKKYYWMIPTVSSPTPKHPISTDTRGTK